MSSGKSTLYQSLSQAYHRLSSNDDEGRGGGGARKKRIYISHINPEAYTLTEVSTCIICTHGHFEADTGCHALPNVVESQVCPYCMFITLIF